MSFASHILRTQRGIRVLRQAKPPYLNGGSRLIEHWYKSRKARWLEANPLLIAGVTSISGFYYENEFLLLGRVRALTTSIVMLATLQPPSDNRGAILFSSSSLNNFETRDIRHYLLLSDARQVPHREGGADPPQTQGRRPQRSRRRS